MGLIKAASSSIKTVLADQWIDYFYCESLTEEVLVTKGKKRVSANSSNTKGTDNYITSGSVIAVADGQCMLVVEQGRVIDICDEPGEYIFDSDRSTGIFSEKEDEPVGILIEKIKNRFVQGGQTALDQRIYYFNTKEVPGNRYGTASPIPFRVIDTNIGLDMDVSLTCFGTFSYRIINPFLFYKNVSGNVSEPFLRTRIDDQLETEVISVLQPVFAKLSANGVRYSALPSHTDEFCNALNDLLSEKWTRLRGIEVVSFAIKGLKAKEEDERMIKELQRNAAFKNPTMAAAQLVGAQSDAMKAAASNTQAGAAAAFIGMNMASAAGKINAQDLYKLGAAEASNVEQSSKQSDTTWICSCGSKNTANFCPVCGTKKPEIQKSAFCSNCGFKIENLVAKYCPNCGQQL